MGRKWHNIRSLRIEPVASFGNGKEKYNIRGNEKTDKLETEMHYLVYICNCKEIKDLLILRS